MSPTTSNQSESAARGPGNPGADRRAEPTSSVVEVEQGAGRRFAVPPTLFKLPSLYKRKTADDVVKDGSAASAKIDGSSDADAVQPTVKPTPPFEIRFDDAHSTDHLHRHVDSTTDTSSGVVVQSVPASTTSLPPHGPAEPHVRAQAAPKVESASVRTSRGDQRRTWIEQFGSKSVVAAVLLLVASATFVAGNRDDSLGGNELDELVKVGDIESGTVDANVGAKSETANTNFRSPELSADHLDNALAKHQPAESLARTEQVPVKTEVATEVPVTVDPVTEMPVVDNGSTSERGDTATGDRSRAAPTVSLAKPNSAMPSSASPTEGVNEPVGLGSPQATGNVGNTNVEISGNQTLSTATPNAIPDWSRYLPAAPQVAAAPGEPSAFEMPAATATPTAHAPAAATGVGVTSTPNDPSGGYQNYLNSGIGVSPAQPPRTAVNPYAGQPSQLQ